MTKGHPTTIGPYRLLDLVGTGGSGQVFRAREGGTGRMVALKLLRPELLGSEDDARRLMREARVCSRLRHEGIVRVHDAGEADGAVFVASDFVKGSSLRELARRGISPARALAVLAAVADALAHAHEEGITHRDLKPENVLVQPDGRPVIVDWGLARSMIESSGITKTGVIVGTPLYMSPEQIEGAPPAPPQDCYALGVMAWELLVGRPPFAGTATADLLTRKLRQEAPSLREALPGVATSLATLVQTLTSRDPSRRPTALEAAQGFTAELGGPLSSPSIQVETLRQTRPQDSSPGRRRPYVVGAFLLACAVLGSLALLRRDGTEGGADPVRVTQARLTRDGRLELVLSRLPGTELRLRLFPGEAPPLVDVGLPPAALHPLPDGRQATTVELPRLPLAPCQVTVTSRDGISPPGVDLDPGPVLASLVDPVARLSTDRTFLDRLAPRLTVPMLQASRDATAAATAPPGSPLAVLSARSVRAARDAVVSLMDEHGVPGPLLDDLGRVLPLLVDERVDAGHPLALHLDPLRLIETAASVPSGPQMPWGNLSALLGVSFRRADGSDTDGTFRQAARTSFLRPGRGNLPRWLWMLPQPERDDVGTLVTRTAGVASNLQGLLGMLLDPWASYRSDQEALPELQDLEASHPFELHVERPSGVQWPPREAAVEFRMRLFSRDTALTLSLAGSPGMRLYHTADLADPMWGWTELHDMLVRVRLSPDRLRTGTMTGVLTVRACPATSSSVHPLCLADARLLVR